MNITQQQVIDHLKERYNIEPVVFEEICTFVLDRTKKLLIDFMMSVQEFNKDQIEKYETLNINPKAQQIFRSCFSMSMLSQLAGAMLALECKLLNLEEREKNGLLEVVVDSIVGHIDRFLDEMPIHSVSVH